MDKIRDKSNRDGVGLAVLYYYFFTHSRPINFSFSFIWFLIGLLC